MVGAQRNPPVQNLLAVEVRLASASRGLEEADTVQAPNRHGEQWLDTKAARQFGVRMTATIDGIEAGLRREFGQMDLFSGQVVAA